MTRSTLRSSRRRALRAMAAAGTLGLPWLSPSTALAQAAWPNRPVRIIFPTGPGGANDAIMRVIGLKLQDIWKQPVVFDFKSGAGIIVGTDFVAKQPADGYTLGIAFGALMSTHILQGSKLPYDTLKDLAAVTEIGNTPFGLYAHPSFPANTVPELIAHLKANPGKVDFTATPTAGASHLAGELFKTMAGVQMTHIAYRGTAASQVDVLSGRVPLWFSSIGEELKGMVNNRQLKIIATTGSTRALHFPQVPTIAETLPGYNVVGILGLITQSGVPRELRNRISADFHQAVQSAEVKDRMVQLGMNPLGSSADQFQARILSEIERWSKVIADAGIKPE
jgi:tripartite-type tricarboxylate transporter receptor subunit TctC